MGYVRVSLPDIEKLKKELEDPEKIVYYNKYGAYTGSLESISYFIKKRNEYYENKKN